MYCIKYIICAVHFDSAADVLSGCVGSTCTSVAVIILLMCHTVQHVFIIKKHRKQLLNATVMFVVLGNLLSTKCQ